MSKIKIVFIMILYLAEELILFYKFQFNDNYYYRLNIMLKQSNLWEYNRYWRLMTAKSWKLEHYERIRQATLA